MTMIGSCITNTSLFILRLLLLLICVTAAAIGQGLPMDKVAKVKQNLGTLGRYMEEDISGHCQVTKIPEWGEIELKQCTYRQKDKLAGYKTATVIMLNPEKDVLAKWIVASCVIVLGMPNKKMTAKFDQCTSKLRSRILQASGAQFPIAGIVLEDQYPDKTKKCPKCKPDGIQEVYTFRDGLTVEVEGGLTSAYTGPFGEDENRIALDRQKAITKAKKYARIQSTSRDEYRSYMGSLSQDVTDAKWVDVIRDLYKDAWIRAHGSDADTIEKYRNDLMVAACYSEMGKKPPSR